MATGQGGEKKLFEEQYQGSRVVRLACRTCFLKYFFSENTKIFLPEAYINNGFGGGDCQAKDKDAG